jgi:hypothetical protein
VSDEVEKLERMLQRATAAENVPPDDLDGETSRLREGWLAFGRLLEAAEPLAEVSFRCLPLPRKRSQRRLWSAAGLLAVSLLFCAVAMWILQPPSGAKNASPAPVQIASTSAKRPAPPSPPAPLPRAGEGSSGTAKPAASASGPQWDDSFDEQVAQLGRQVIDAQQSSSAWADTGAAVQSKIEQIQQEFKDNNL